MRTVAADATDAEQVRRALDGVEVAYYLVHSLGSTDFAERDRRAADVVAAEAERAGLAQIVYLGGLGEDRPDLSAHLRSRLDTAAALAAGRVPVTTIRAAVVIGRGSAAFETIVALVDRLPAMVAPRWISTPTQPIALDDVVRYLVGVGGNPDAIGQSLDAGGPEVLTYKEMLERIARIRGRRPLIVEVPLLTPEALLVLAPSRHAGARGRRAAADRGPPQPDGRRRRPHPAAAPVPAHVVRRRGPRRARVDARPFTSSLPPVLSDIHRPAIHCPRQPRRKGHDMSYTLLLHDADREVRALRRNSEPQRVRAELARERGRRTRRFPSFPRLGRAWTATGAGASS